MVEKGRYINDKGMVAYREVFDKVGIYSCDGDLITFLPGNFTDRDYDSYYWYCVSKRMKTKRQKLNMRLQKFCGVVILLMCAIMFMVACRDSGNTDATATLLFLPMGVYCICSKGKLLS